MSAVEALRMRVRAELGLVNDAGGAIDVLRALRAFAAHRGLEVAAAEVLADAARFHGFLSELTVTETHFLRHPAQLAALVSLLAPALRRGEVREVWSAGCSSGEEPYSVALLLAEELGPQALSMLRVIGTDASERAIARGRAARYSPWSFRGCPPWLRRHFRSSPEGLELASSAVRRAVTLDIGEIVERARRFAPGALDAVLFRNVGIYFGEDHLRAFYAAVSVALKPGAMLIVGPADPRPDSGFCPDDSDPDRCRFFAAAASRRGAPPPAPAPVEGGPQRARRHRASETAAAGAERDGTAPKQLPLEPALRPPPAKLRSTTPRATPSSPEAILERARRAADAGNLRSARELVAPLVETMEGAPVSWWPEALTLLGQVELDASDDPRVAVEVLRRAVFLAPADPRPRFWYGLALQRLGRPEATLAQLREAARLLDEERETDGGDELRSAVAAALELMR